MKPLFVRAIFLLVLSAILAFAVSIVKPLKIEEHDPIQINLVELNTLLERQLILWVDARSEEEYETDHISSAVLLNEDNWDGHFPTLLDSWTPNQTIVVYCSGVGCELSKSVAIRLREEMGIESVFYLKDDWEKYR